MGPEGCLLQSIRRAFCRVSRRIVAILDGFKLEKWPILAPAAAALAARVHHRGVPVFSAELEKEGHDHAGAIHTPKYHFHTINSPVAARLHPARSRARRLSL
jgi:hypothetical protein